LLNFTHADHLSSGWCLFRLFLFFLHINDVTLQHLQRIPLLFV